MLVDVYAVNIQDKTLMPLPYKTHPTKSICHTVYDTYVGSPTWYSINRSRAFLQVDHHQEQDKKLLIIMLVDNRLQPPTSETESIVIEKAYTHNQREKSLTHHISITTTTATAITTNEEYQAAIDSGKMCKTIKEQVNWLVKYGLMRTTHVSSSSSSCSINFVECYDFIKAKHIQIIIAATEQMNLCVTPSNRVKIIERVGLLSHGLFVLDPNIKAFKRALQTLLLENRICNAMQANTIDLHIVLLARIINP
jgi:hypothetical protein